MNKRTILAGKVAGNMNKRTPQNMNKRTIVAGKIAGKLAGNMNKRTPKSCRQHICYLICIGFKEAYMWCSPKAAK